MVDVFWLVLSAMLVMLMQGGFLCLESGLTRSKNNINTAFKNLLDLSIVISVFWAVGYGVMFGASNGWMGGGNYFHDFKQLKPEQSAFFLLQVMFCGTTVTIVSGAIAERTRFVAYIVISLLTSALTYPVAGHWVWNGIAPFSETAGWLEKIGFVDFAGSTVVHSIGGWVALAAVLVIGNRAGLFVENQEPSSINGSNIPMSVFGVMLLWFGWLGFNGGSTLAFDERVPFIIANTIIAGASGLLTAIIFSLFTQGYVRSSWFINGSLAGLVSITASVNAVNSVSAFLIGIIGALIMIFIEAMLLKFRIDDAVGAIPVHLGAGIWGTLAVVFFADTQVLNTGLGFWQQLGVQLIGILVCGFWSFGLTYVVLKSIDKIFPLRVSEEHESIGLNISEHDSSTEILDLLKSMEKQASTGDMSLRAKEEPFTLAGQIARQYNLVLNSLQNMQLQLIQAAKLASLGEMAASIAHELNQPLQVLKIATENVAEEVKDAKIENLDDTLKLMDKNVDKGSSIVNQLRNFGRKTTSDDRKAVEINQCVDNVLLMLNKQFQQKNIDVRLNLAASLPTFLGNFIQIEQIITNLMVNARDALEETDEKGEKRTNRKIMIRTFQKEDRIVLEVEDTAGGIPEDALPHIFESFYTTKPEGVGTGLGLSICNTIINEHKGKFEVNSKQGEGSTFIVSLPISKDETTN